MSDHERHVHPDPVPLVGAALRVERPRATTIRVHDNRRDPLRQDGLSAPELWSQKPFRGVGVHVDEPRGDVEPGGIDLDLGGVAREPAHGGDPIPPDPYIRADPGVSGTIEHASTAEDDVVGLGRGACGDRQGETTDPRYVSKHHAVLAES